MDTENIGAFAALLVFCGTIIMGIWSKVSFAKKRDIYNEDGTTKFPVVAECNKNHRHMCQQLSKIDSRLENMDRARNETRAEWAEAVRALNRDVGVLQGQVKTLIERG